MSNQNNQHWLTLWQQIGATGDADEVYINLVRQYSESHRAYHTLSHIEHCLVELEQVRQLATNPEAIELAIWFHDVIYDTEVGNNEERSADFAIEVMKKALLPDDFVRLVTNLVLVTKHSLIIDDFDCQLIVDIDLAIFGQPEIVFFNYEKQIRQEYDWVFEEQFAAGRSAILKSFLERQRIYLTDFFHDKYETQARRNIIQSLACLQS
jgi:predicted metal-dependent HD superfamily phosphohydrolase